MKVIIRLDGISAQKGVRKIIKMLEVPNNQPHIVRKKVRSFSMRSYGIFSECYTILGFVDKGKIQHVGFSVQNDFHVNPTKESTH